MGCRRLAPDPFIGLLSPEFGSTTRDARVPRVTSSTDPPTQRSSYRQGPLGYPRHALARACRGQGREDTWLPDAHSKWPAPRPWTWPQRESARGLIGTRPGWSYRSPRSRDLQFRSPRSIERRGNLSLVRWDFLQRRRRAGPVAANGDLFTALPLAPSRERCPPPSPQ